jgi:hypothetical protein
MTKAGLQFLILALPLSVCGCGKSGTSSRNPETASAMDQLCAAIKETGIAGQCSFSERDNMVNVVIDSGDDEKARRACAGLAARVTKDAANFSGQGMKLRIYSPYRSDKALATCSLDSAGGSAPY